MLIDVAPSINLLQTCAMVYGKSLLIPVSMDPLSLQGAAASIENSPHAEFPDLDRYSAGGVAPVMVDRRLQITEVVTASLKDLSVCTGPVLAGIRTDTTVTKCNRAKKFLADFEPHSKALEDYQTAFEELLNLLHGEPRQNEDNPRNRRPGHSLSQSATRRLWPTPACLALCRFSTRRSPR